MAHFTFIIFISLIYQIIIVQSLPLMPHNYRIITENIVNNENYFNENFSSFKNLDKRSPLLEAQVSSSSSTN